MRLTFVANLTPNTGPVLTVEVPRPSLFVLHSYWGPWCRQEALKERVNIHNRALGVLPLQDRRATGSRTGSELCWLYSLPKLGRESHAEQASRDCWALEQMLVMALVMTPLDEENGNWFIILSASSISSYTMIVTTHSHLATYTRVLFTPSSQIPIML